MDQNLVRATGDISIMEIFFSVALIILFAGKVKNKKKVITSKSYVPDLYKSHPRASEKSKISWI